jgi:hypothetical protein
MPSEQLIDRFVETINRLPREPGSAEDIPPSVRGETDREVGLALYDWQSRAWSDSGLIWYDWQIRAWPDIDWIAPVERAVGATLPRSYRSLVTRYVFPAFDTDTLSLSANTPEGTFREFRKRVFGDPMFVAVILSAGYIPFAQPDECNYDPVCFDTRRRDTSGECPIVRLEHESILCNGVIGDTEEISPSFAALVDEFVRRHAETTPGTAADDI